MTEITKVVAATVRTGHIIQINGDNGPTSKYGMALDPDLLETIGDRTFLSLSMTHYQIQKIFGIQKVDDSKSRKWVRFIKQLRDAVTDGKINDAFKASDEDGSAEWTPKACKRSIIIDKVSDVIDVAFEFQGKEIQLSTAKPHDNRSNMLKVELNDDSLAFLLSAFYEDPPEPVSKSRRITGPREKASEYDDFPNVKVRMRSYARGAPVKVVYINLHAGKEMSKTIYKEMTHEAEITHVKYLQTMYDNSVRGSDGADDQGGVGGVTTTPIGSLDGWLVRSTALSSTALASNAEADHVHLTEALDAKEESV